jgi:hypothetical protein
LNWIKSWVPQAIQPLLQLLGSGVGLVVILMVLPGGVGSVLFRARDFLLRRVADRRGIVVPSLVADKRATDDADAVDVAATAAAEAEVSLAEVAAMPPVGQADTAELMLEPVGAAVGSSAEERP